MFKRVYFIINLLPFMNAANTNAAPSSLGDRVTREEITTLFAKELKYRPPK